MNTTLSYRSGGAAAIVLSSDPKYIKGFPPGEINTNLMRYSSNTNIPPILIGYLDTGGELETLNIEVNTDPEVSVYLHNCGAVNCNDTWVPLVGNLRPRSGSFAVEQHLCGKGWRLRNLWDDTSVGNTKVNMMIYGIMNVYINDKFHYSAGPGLTILCYGDPPEEPQCDEGYTCVYNTEFAIPCKIRIEFSGGYCGLDSNGYTYAAWPER